MFDKIPIDNDADLLALSETLEGRGDVMKVMENFFLGPHSATGQVFQGREDVLKEMENFFLNQDPATSQPRSFALFGEGGIGKSQMVLRYIKAFQAHYGRQILLVNASTPESLRTSFARYTTIMQLPGEDSVSSVKKFLSKPNKHKWLIVFDNADDLESLNLQQYIPSIPYGHIIITSRDPGVQAMSDGSYNLQGLSTNDSMQVLRAVAETKTDAEQQALKKLAHALGGLPLALIQAGSWVKSTGKTFGQYLERYTITLEKSQLTLGNNAALTTSELIFDRLEEENSQVAADALTLISLFSFLDSVRISEFFLDRACSPQGRWGTDGEVIQVSAEAEGVDQDLTTLISNKTDFNNAISKLVSFSLITSQIIGYEGMRLFRVQPLVQEYVVNRLQSQTRNWRLQALLFVCHAFPRGYNLDRENGEAGYDIIPHLRRVLAASKALSETDRQSVPREVIGAVIHSPLFSGSKWSRDTVEYAKSFLREDGDDHYDDDDEVYWQASVAYRHLVNLKNDNEHEAKEFEKLGQKYANPMGETPWGRQVAAFPRSMAKNGQYRATCARGMIRKARLDDAFDFLSEWIKEASSSAAEASVRLTIDRIRSRILRYLGKFQEALENDNKIIKALESSLNGQHWRDAGDYFLAVSTKAEMLVELDRQEEAAELLEGAIAQLENKGGKDSLAGKRLELAMAEVLLACGRFAEAEEILVAYKAFLSNDDEPFKDSPLFRTLICLARVYHLQGKWEKAIETWESAIQAGKGRLVPTGLAEYSLACAQALQNDNEIPAAPEAEGDYPWLTGFQTKWRAYLLAKKD